MPTLDISAALSEGPRTDPLLHGKIAPQGLRLITTALHGSEMFWRQLKYSEFDVSEMSLASLTIATSRGPTEWVAIPVFTMRLFFHTNVLVRTDSGIAVPADLRGKRIGVPEYQQTAAVWSRGVLQDEFGVDPRDLHWYMERPPEQSHGGAIGFEPPAGIDLKYIPSSTNIGKLLLAGDLDATLLYLNTRNLVDRSRADLQGEAQIRTLFPDPKAEARRYYAKTKIFPINHTVVVRRSLLERHPWIALNLFEAFSRINESLAAQRALLLDQYFAAGILHDDARSAIADDPIQYGIRATRPVLETVTRYVFEQGLTKRLVGLEELFAPSVMGL